MINKTYTGEKNSYTASRELGKGGEGQVYELANNYSQVLKIYNEALDSEKIEKLRTMVAMGNAQTLNYAAWPVDIVKESGAVVGFVMKKLDNYMPLHMLFSPMDRKKNFPDKGYNFLVHVARNLATAFYALHSQGLVIGDVNEGNILVNAQGMVAFIDCDSFQIKNSSGYFFCEVGVPRYTPPELLSKSSFNNVIRSINTDSFSMAVLIFQLLFLGRHPFAGRNMSNEDIDEEAAIKKCLFAYSTNKVDKKLLPPNDSFPINNLSQQLVALFHSSFENEIARPQPELWMKALDEFSTEMITCEKHKIHVYPSTLVNCPWCDFKDRRNIYYFLDDSYTQQIPTYGDMDKFINGFKVEKLNLKNISFPKQNKQAIPPTPVLDIYKSYQLYHRIGMAVIGVIAVLIGIYATRFSFVSLFLIGCSYKLLPWHGDIVKEMKRRELAYKTQGQILEAVLKEYNSPKELNNYNNNASKLERSIDQFKRLPAELQKRKREMEEEVYNTQLHVFLHQFLIEDFTIAGFGASRKATLASAGIRTAGDITKLASIKVAGIGPKFIQNLLSWQRLVASRYTYTPDSDLLQTRYNLIATQIEQQKRHLENEIKRDYNSLNYLKVSILNRQTQLETQINSLHKEYCQSIVDYEAFNEKFGGII
jgi:DNA-binding helix-hairpin-helix protein with protein kinase domain